MIMPESDRIPDIDPDEDVSWDCDLQLPFTSDNGEDDEL